MNATETLILIVFSVAYIALVALAWKVYRMPLGSTRKKQPLNKCTDKSKGLDVDDNGVMIRICACSECLNLGKKHKKP